MEAHFTNVKKEEALCTSENSKKEKDPLGTVLTLLDLHLNAGKDTTKTKLIPIILALILGQSPDLTEGVIFNCATLKVIVKGVVSCEVSPGLTNTSTLSVSCKTNATTHDPEIPPCEVLCEEFGGKVGLTGEFGKTKEDSWESVNLSGTANKDFFIDD